jgi:DNA-binding response OmpR family regulator
MDYSGTILIVDDQLSGREILRGLLAKQNYYLAFASSGPEALEQARQLTPDLILLDVMMPGMSGFEVCRTLRADAVLAEVPVIMVTALDDQESLVEGIEAGADDFISKPFNHAELRTRIRTITRLNRYRHLMVGRAKFEWVVEQASDGYIVLDEADQILYANPQARLYLGLASDRLELAKESFRRVAQLQYQFEPEQGWANWPETPATEAAPVRYLVRPETNSAQTFWLQVNSQKLPPSSEGAWLVQLQNVTSQIASQRDIWEFQSLISHRLRTPLSNILNGLYYLTAEEVTQKLPPEMAELLDLVAVSAQNLEQDIQDILEYVATPALIEPGAGFRLDQLPALVTQVSMSLELVPAAILLPATWTTERVVLSEQAIELILQETLENAKKFHPNHTPLIEIRTTRLNDAQICLEISDDGQTLSPDQLAQVWGPYYQGEKYFTGAAAGMGLGLSRVAMLVWSVGGRCTLTNRENQTGVTVTLIIPLQLS